MTIWNMLVKLMAMVLLGMLSGFALPWLRQRIGAERLKTIWKWVCVGVQAAEQIFDSGEGEEKKNYVLDLLEQMGMKASDPLTDALIEAAVKELT